jgi:Thioesterase superfamily
MRVLVKGLRVPGSSNLRQFTSISHLHRLFHTVRFSEARSPLNPPSITERLLSPHSLFNRPRTCLLSRHLHYSLRQLAQDAQANRPPNIPEAEWARMNSEFERRASQKAWFFRPIYRFFGNPQYQIANLTIQIALVGGIVGLWLYAWFFMGYAGVAPPKTDGTGTLLTDEEVVESETIENYLHSHPVVQAIRSQKYLIESRPHWAIPDKDVPHSFTGGTLRGLGRMSVAPIAFTDGEGMEFYAVCHIGRDVCGPYGMVHDGILATIMDESLARCCFPALPNRIGVTANLNITFLQPLPADSYILIRVLQCHVLLT